MSFRRHHQAKLNLRTKLPEITGEQQEKFEKMRQNAPSLRKETPVEIDGKEVAFWCDGCDPDNCSGCPPREKENEMENNWSDKFPEELGEYWFYGDPWGKGDEKPDMELYFIKVRQASNALVYIGGGFFMYKIEAVGMWKKVDMPDLPEKEMNNG